MQLRPYQEALVAQIRAQYQLGHRSVLAALPTGGGKTVIFSYITENAAARGKKVLILVHRRELISQTSATLTSLGVSHGVIAASWKEANAPVQVASVQTLARRLHKNTFNPDLIIIDEAHHAVAGTWGQILGHFSTAKLLGVTATPMRLDGKGLKDFFNVLVVGPSVAKLTQKGYLAKARCFSIPIILDRKALRKSKGDYIAEEVVQTLEDLHINGNAIKEYKRRCPGAPTIVFCTNKKHAEMMAGKFRDAGFRSAFLHDGVNAVTRKGLIDYLGKGELDILTSVNVISEGTDIPVVTTAILLRPTESEAMYRQQVGRVLRPAKGKDCAIIIDCVGNIRNFGLPEDEPDYTLEDKKTKAPPVKMCPECYAMLPSLMKECPECGHVFEAESRDPKDKEPPLEVNLVEVFKVERPISKQERQVKIDAANNLGELYELAKKWGYKRGWAWHIWQERQQKPEPSVLELLRMPEKQQEDVSVLRSRVSKAMAIKSIATSLSQLQEVAELMEYDPEWPYREAQRLGIPVHGQ